VQEVMQLVEELAALDVRMAVNAQGQLELVAARGVLNDELRRRLAANKAGVVRWLQRQETAGASEPSTRISTAPAQDREPAPLSDLQLGFLMADDPHMEFHVRPHCYMETDYSDFDATAYEAAWNRVLQRHRRELYVVSSDDRLQLVDNLAPIQIHVEDLRHRPVEEVDRRLAQIRAELERHELPLHVWPWFVLRISLRSVNGRDIARVHYNHNSFFIDGLGTSLLLAEIDACYRDPSFHRPPLEISGRDAILALEKLAASPPGERARQYWLSRIDALPAPPALGLRTHLSKRRRSRLNRRDGSLSRETWERFKRTAGACGVTASNAIITAYAHVLATWSNSDHFILSQMITRRMPELHPDMAALLGNFVSLYPLEIRLQGAATFAENADALQRQVLADVRHIEYGGMRVLQELNRRRGELGSAPSPFVVGSGLALKNPHLADFVVLETCQTLLDHQFFERADGSYYFVWDLLEEFFPDGVIDAMYAAYTALLDQLATNEQAWQQTLHALQLDFDLRARVRCNETASPVPASRLEDALAEHAKGSPRRLALSQANGTLDYEQLSARAETVARTLREAGAQPGDRVAVILEKGPELLSAVLGILRAGAAYVPIDPRSPPDRIEMLLQDTDPLAVISAGRVEIRTPRIERSAPGDLAYVIHTSGSTGKPKGVMIDHRGALNTVLDINRRFDVTCDDRIFGVSAFNFDLSVYDVFGTLAAGARLVYPEPRRALTPSHWLDLMVDEGITVWNSVPALMQLLVDEATARGVTLPALRLVMLSGDKIPLDLPDAIRAMAPHARLVSLGGATEASIWSIYYPVESIDPHWNTIPYGFPLANQRWHCRDRHGQPTPTWVAGELCIEGIGVALGYWNDPERTQPAFHFGASASERLYRTGDLGRYLPDGCIEWLGRVDHQVKIQGHRIEPGEIEARLLSHPSMQQVAVVAPRSATGQPRTLVAHVVLKDSTTEQDLEAFLRERLPAHMVPTGWRIWSQLPLTPNGKIDRSSLERAGRHSRESPRTARRRVPVSGVAEARLQSIWQDVLGIDVIGATDDFFELGGQSYDAIRIFSRLQREYHRTYSLGDLWKTRTIRALAKLVEGTAVASDTAQWVAINRRASGQPLFLAHPAGGSVLGYYALGKMLSRPLHAVQAAATPSEIELRTLAGSYVQMLRTERPRGPYTLGGWSTGAIVAFAMCAELEAAGESVQHLYLLDGPVPFARGQISAVQLLAWFLDDVAPGSPVDRVLDHNWDGVPVERSLTQAAEMIELAARSPLDPAMLAPAFLQFRELVLAANRYEPVPVDAPITVIRAKDDVVREFAAHPHRGSPDWGWRPFTRGSLRCIEAPGTHYTFLAEPHLASWCSLLNDTFEEDV
jgi:amino acid adenylation domain-containing protein